METIGRATLPLLAWILGLVACCGAPQLAWARSYSTNFPLTENPISEGGNWVNGKTLGLDWQNVRTTPGFAFGTESGAGGYDDTTALVTGAWGPNQTAQATVRSVNQTVAVYEEVELRLRSSISAHRNTGYEILFRAVHPGGYTQIVRWNGPLGDFTYISQNANNNYHGIQDGDVVSASINGSTIIGYVNGVEVIRGTDSTFTTGSPGMGFFLQGGTSALNADFGFTKFAATDAPLGLTSIAVAPSSASVKTGGTQLFTATAKDQLGNLLSPQPAFTWTVSGGGSISLAGLFTAGSAGGGPFTVRASSGSVSGTASVTVLAARSPRGDFDGDRKEDLLLRKSSTGEVYLWLMR